MSVSSGNAHERPRLVDWLFTFRAAALRLLDPLDRLALRISGRSHFPPLSLRRHVGPVRQFEIAAIQTRDWLTRFDLVSPGASVLDIGCGCGVMVPILEKMIGDDGRYLGFDVYEPAIAWCRKAYSGKPRISFEVADVSSPYSDSIGAKVEDYRFPTSEQTIDFVLAKSLFTHLQPAEAQHYLREIYRVLRPGGQALVSVFLFSRDLAGKELFEGLPYPRDASATVRWRLDAKPEAAIAFDGEQFKSWLAASNLTLREFVPIYWPGKSSVFTGQDLLILYKE